MDLLKMHNFRRIYVIFLLWNCFLPIVQSVSEMVLSATDETRGEIECTAIYGTQRVVNYLI